VGFVSTSTVCTPQRTRFCTTGGLWTTPHSVIGSDSKGCRRCECSPSQQSCNNGKHKHCEAMASASKALGAMVDDHSCCCCGPVCWLAALSAFVATTQLKNNQLGFEYKFRLKFKLYFKCQQQLTNARIYAIWTMLVSLATSLFLFLSLAMSWCALLLLPKLGAGRSCYSPSSRSLQLLPHLVGRDLQKQILVRWPGCTCAGAQQRFVSSFELYYAGLYRSAGAALAPRNR
jgi:hypothetical protein